MGQRLQWPSLAPVAALAALVGLAGCGQPLAGRMSSTPAPTTTAEHQLVVQTADGHYLSVSCLKSRAMSAAAREACDVSLATNKSALSKSKYTFNGYGYVLYPPNYSQQGFCAYMNYGFPCYSFFGYPSQYDAGGSNVSLNLNYSYSNGSGVTSTWANCDTCLTNPFQYACLFGNSWSCVTSSTTYVSDVPSPVQVACAGNATGPHYAYYDFGSAHACGVTMAEQGCGANALVGYCLAYPGLINIAPTTGCLCNAWASPVGSWE